MSVNLRIKKKNIDDNAIDGSKIKLLQNESVKAVDSSGSTVDLVKLDASGNVIGNGYELAKKAELSQETSDRISGDNSLDARLNVLQGSDSTAGSVSKSLKDAKSYADTEIEKEKSARIAADEFLQGNIDNEITARIGALRDEQSARVAAISSEVSSRIEADELEFSARTVAVSSEESARITADNSLSDRILTFEADENTSGSLLKVFKDAKSYADAKVNVEKTRAMNTESEEASIRYSADYSLQSAIDDEAFTRANEILREEGSRQYADQEIQSRITSEVTSIYVSINEEASARRAETSARISGDNSLDSRVDVLQGDENTAGSVNKALKDAKQYTDEKALAADSNLLAAINLEVTSRQAAVSVETSSRISGDASLDSRVDVLQGDENTVGSVNKALKDAKDYALGQVNNEKTRAIGAENSLNAKIDFVKSNTNDAALDSLTEIVAAFQAADGNLNNAITNISANINAGLYEEITSRRAADYELSLEVSLEMQSRASAINTENSARRAADTTLQNNINAEILARQSAITAETSSRVSGDNSLDSRIDVLQGDENTAGSVNKALKDAKAYTDVEVSSRLLTTISAEVVSRQSAIDAETSSRISGDASLDSRVDVLQGDENTAGSVNKALKDAKQYALDRMNDEKTRAVGAENSLNAKLDFVKSNVDGAALDSLTEIVAAFQAADGNLNNAITNISANINAGLYEEITSRRAADSSLDSRVDVLQGDENTAGSVNKALKDAKDYALGQVNNEKTRAIGAEGSLQNRLSAEESARASAIVAEASSRVAGDDSLETRIENAKLDVLDDAKDYTDSAVSAEESARILDVNTETTARVNAINAEASARTNADNQLYEMINDEIGDRVTAVNNESNSRSTAVTNLTNQINAERNSRQNALATLQDELNDEGSYRVAADVELQEQIDALLGRVDAVEISSAEGGSSFDLEEQSARIAADTSLENMITNLVGAAPALLDTLKELSDALGQDENFATTISNKFSVVEASLTLATQDSVVYTNEKHQEIVDLISETLLKQEVFVITEENTSNGYVELVGTDIVSRSVSAFVDRLCIFEGEDYSLSTVNGAVRLTFLNSFAADGEEAIEEGDSLRVTYWSFPS